MIPAPRFFYFLMMLILAPGLTSAQTPPATGTPPFGSFGGGPDVINLANLNSHLAIPVLHKSGRGTNFTYDLSYDSSVWYPVGSIGNQSWQPVANWGWRGVTEVATGYVSYKSTQRQCFNSDLRRYYPYTVYSNWAYHDSFGVSHDIGAAVSYFNDFCTDPNPYPDTATVTANDGSGYVISVTANPAATVTSRDGTTINPPLNSSSAAASFTDRNGNMINVSTSGAFTDTLGTTALAVAGTAPSNTTFTYTPPAGGSAAYTMKYTTYSLQTNFGCSGITDYGTNGTTTANLVSEIDLPDWNPTTNPNSRYTFTYENTPGHGGFVTGRLASVTLPTGGTISYSYSGGSNGIVCADGSTAGFQRAINDGTNNNTWTYAHSESGTAWTTLITDPQGNQTNMNFQGIYETQRQVSQLVNGSQSLLRQWTTCYNGNTSNCNSTAISLPITQRTVTDQYGATGLQCKHNYLYNSVGGLTEQDDYDYGSGGPGGLLRQILITYASLPPNITAFRQTVIVKNGSGTTVSQTNYNYDETTPAPTSGITQHTSVSGSRGNLTSVNYPVSGLTSHSSYYDTGVLNTSQDVNGATTTYNYSSTNNAYCNWAFPTSVSEPSPNVAMSRLFAWNCTGGVMTSLTDENSQVTSITYGDPYFWRPASESFPDGGQTSWTYNSQTSITTTAKMNSSQNIASTVLLDGLGRTTQTQLNSDPLGVDYSVITYDSLGRPYRTYNPTRCSTPTTNCGEATWGYTATAYDPLNRPASMTLQDGSVLSATYTNNTVTATDPAGKKRQSTLDALGRMTQLNEDPSGLNYVTTYGYDALGNLTNVTQNGGRSRTYVYDAMSRLTSERACGTAVRGDSLQVLLTRTCARDAS